jgi:hypothetical protein
LLKANNWTGEGELEKADSNGHREVSESKQVPGAD